MSVSVYTVSDQWLKRLLRLSNRAETLSKKVRRYTRIGYDTTQLMEGLNKTQEEIQKILWDYSGFEQCDEEEIEAELNALEERMHAERIE